AGERDRASADVEAADLGDGQRLGRDERDARGDDENQSHDECDAPHVGLPRRRCHQSSFDASRAPFTTARSLCKTTFVSRPRLFDRMLASRKIASPGFGSAYSADDGPVNGRLPLKPNPGSAMDPPEKGVR